MDKILDEREICDLECLEQGAFAPLESYMTKDQYSRCLKTMKISDLDVFPVPIVCTMPFRTDLVDCGTIIRLKSPTGIIHANLIVQECWIPDLKEECEAVFGCYDTNHPYIQYMLSKGPVVYVSGNLTIENRDFHKNFKEFRGTPAQLKKGGPWVGFQTRNPLHRSHIELIRNATGISKILLHPVEGVTQECDIPFPVRMKCYKDVLPYLGDVSLSILPLSMRMAGPREAVWHAVIRRNYGCSHFIVGRDHAGPSYKKKDGTPFYDPMAAQRLAKSMESEIGLVILPSEELVYCDKIEEYLPVSKAKQMGHTTNQISGTMFRTLLETNQEVPSWYSFESVVETLKKYYQKPKGSCYYFVGLSGSGKSTLAEGLKAFLEEQSPEKEVTLLDADVIRTHLSKGLGFSKEERSMNVRRIGYVASEIVKHGGTVIVANIAPYEEDREFNRKLISQYGNYVQFFVDTPLEVCEARDVKGLYKAARNGAIKQFTGISDPFEIPSASSGVLVPLMPEINTIYYVCDYVANLK